MAMLNLLFCYLYQHLYSTCHITLRLHVQELTVMSGAGNDPEPCETAAKWKDHCSR